MPSSLVDDLIADRVWMVEQFSLVFPLLEDKGNVLFCKPASRVFHLFSEYPLSALTPGCSCTGLSLGSPAF